MKKHLLTTWLLSIMMVFGVGSAWADATILYERGTTNNWVADDLTDWSPSATNDYLTYAISGGLKLENTAANNNFKSSYSATKSIAPTDKSIVTLSATVTMGAATGRASSYDYIKIAGTELRVFGQDKKAQVYVDGIAQGSLVDAVRNGSYVINITIDQATNDVTYSVSGSSTIAEAKTTSNTAITDVVFGHSRGGSENYNSALTLTKIEISEEAQTVSTAGYTVKYFCGEFEIKDADTSRSGVVGSKVSLTESDKASFKVENTKKYIYVSDDSDSNTIEGDGSTIITVTFREAATWSYTANAMNASSKIAEIANGSTFEGEEVTVPYHYYYNIDSTLYKKDALNKEYNYTFTLNSDNQVEELAYTASSINNVIFLSEAEDIATLTAVTGGGVGIRCSNSSGAFADEEALITTLTPGKYKLTGAGYGGNLVFKAGTVEILNMETVGYQRETPSEEFVIYTNTDITFIGGSNNNAALDYVFIQKTGDVTAEEIALANAKAALQADIDAAKAIDTTGKELAESLAGAITTAETLLNAVDATVESLSAAQEELAKVVEAYEMANAKTIFLAPGPWNVDGARYAAYVWKEKGNTWFDFAAAEEDGVYTIAIPESYTGLILARMNGAIAENNWEKDTLWNKTADIDFTAVADSTLFTITGWNATDFETSKYVKAEPVLNTYTAKFKTNAAWDKVYAYTWTGEGEGKVEQLGTWPGTEITETINDDNDDYDIYTATINTEAAPAYIIFNNGNENGVEGKTKTADLAFEDGKEYELMITVSKLMEDAIALAADDEAVAVGKLLEAIKWAYDNDDESKLQAAIDQFKADNADTTAVEADVTNKVGTAKESWTGATGTYSKDGIGLVERYGTSDPGVMMSQEVSVENGTYNVKLYATSHNAWNNNGANLQEDAGDVAYVFASSGEHTLKTWITARRNKDMIAAEPEIYTINGLEVADGKITMGLSLDKAGQTEWHTIQIASLEKIHVVTAKEAFAEKKADMNNVIADARALSADALKTEGQEAFATAIDAAVASLTDNTLNITEFEAKIAELKAAMEAFKQANYTTFNGKYYVQNAASGKFMAAGHDYGTRGIVDGTGLDITLKANENKTVDFDSQIFNGDSKHFLGSNLYMDSDSWGWIIEKAGEDVYTISNGTQYIGVDENDNLVLQSEAANWKFVTREDRIAALNAATEENGIDATFLIQGANFSRGDGRVAASWSVSDDCTNKNLQGGAQTNMCAESYHSTFTIMQTISGAPAGLYKMTAQGFYRQDEFEGDAPAAPQFFANDVNKDVPVRTGSENSMSDASASFTAGNYTIEPIDFVVTKEGDDAGKIYVGITNQNKTQWVIWDNFQLTYYGPAPATTYTVTVAETQNGTVEVDKTEAAENETVSVTVTPADGYMVDEAYWTYGEGENETKTQIGEPAEGNTATFIMPAANVTITVTFKAVAAEPVYYVVGTMNNWTPSDEYKMTLNEEAEGVVEYMITLDLEANAELKVVKNNSEVWYPEGMDNNFQISEAGEYDIYFRPNYDGGDDWYYNVIYVAKKENAQPEFPENVIYSWESPAGEPIEFGGTIAYVNGDGDRLNYTQGGYYTICLNGKKGNLDDKTASANAGHMVITLENAVEAGDTIFYTAFLNKNESKKASPYFVFENGTTAEGEVFGDEENIDAKFNGVPTLKYTIVPEDAAGSKTITLTRSQTGTNLFITKLQIMQYDPTTGISIVKTAIENGAIYNLNGQKVNKAQKGLYIINGKKVVIK